MHYRVIANGLTNPCLQMVNFKRMRKRKEPYSSNFDLFSGRYIAIAEHAYVFTHLATDACIERGKECFLSVSSVRLGLAYCLAYYVCVLENSDSNRVCTITWNIRNSYRRLCTEYFSNVWQKCVRFRQHTTIAQAISKWLDFQKKLDNVIVFYSHFLCSSYLINIDGVVERRPPLCKYTMVYILLSCS